MTDHDDLDRKISDLERKKRLVRAERELWEAEHPILAGYRQGLSFALPMITCILLGALIFILLVSTLGGPK